MQSVSSRIWTRVAESISCEDNHYTTGTRWFPLLPGSLGTIVVVPFMLPYMDQVELPNNLTVYKQMIVELIFAVHIYA